MKAWKPLAQQFYFENFTIEKSGVVRFRYATDAGHIFDHEFHFQPFNEHDLDSLRPAVFALGMAELCHFWKATLAPLIIVKAGQLSKEQIAFWENLYVKGLGEFFYVNKIDVRGLMRIESAVDAPVIPPSASQPKHGALVSLGGGKDSLVAGETLKKAGKKFTWFELEPLSFTAKLRTVSGIEQTIQVGRNVQKNFAPIIELVKHGAPNGHVPITATYILSAVLAGKAGGFSDVVMALERSANEGNVTYLGEVVNHQYSKSFEFERAVYEYVRTYVDPQLRVFSVLRPFYEIQIVADFVRYPQYFPYFVSCNRGLHNGTWCGVCAKCAFMFAGLSAFLPPDTVVGLFKKNLFEDESLIPLFRDMIGKGRMKPFDCVGTFEENLLALFLAGEQYQKAGLPLPPVLTQLPIGEGGKYMSLLTSISIEHLIPNDYRGAWPKVGIAGFGVEGRATYDYLQGKADIHIFTEHEQNADSIDATFHKGLTVPAEVTLVFKSPGIPTAKLKCDSPTTRVSTLMDAVMEKVKGNAIGVTGTKGKSTVASLVAHMLTRSGRPNVLMGNIGVVDMRLLDESVPGTVYVLELSSYQCEYLTQSPHVAVLTNFYPEHLNHHGNLDAYREAKLNLARFQKKDDIFVDNSGIGVSFEGTKVVPQVSRPFETKLLGEHNQTNCAIALAAVTAVGVTEVEARQHIATFEPLPYRLEPVGTFKGVTFYDDSLATIPEATLASLQALPRVDTIILGGEDRGVPLDSFAKALSRTSVSTFITFPDTGAKMTEHLANRTVIQATSMEEAVRAAYTHTPSGGVVLLSNASPSFNMFKDYKDKSAQYREHIRAFSI